MHPECLQDYQRLEIDHCVARFVLRLRNASAFDKSNRKNVQIDLGETFVSCLRCIEHVVFPMIRAPGKLYQIPLD
jgi:hypothetical protein